MWVRNSEVDVFARVAHVLLPKDYVRFRLTDNYAIDRTGGSGTIDGLVDAALDRDWGVTSMPKA
jgi:xylulokinase